MFRPVRCSTVRRRSAWLALAAAFGGMAPELSAQSAARAEAGTASAAPSVPVATRQLARGTVLSASDMSMEGVAPLHGRERDALIVAPGWVTRRLVRAGEPLRPPAVAPAPLVAAGSAVRLVIRGEAFRMSVDGVAAVAASLGDTIPVRLGAGRRVRGVITGPAEVVAVDSQRNP